MPRIELEMEDGAIQEIDVCHVCARSFEKDEEIPAGAFDQLTENGVEVDELSYVVDTDIPHDSYEWQELECAICCDELTPEDD